MVFWKISHAVSLAQHVDVLIVDEAAQASEPELLIPMYLSPTKALLIGDPNQLPATVFSSKAEKFGFGVSCMERLMRANYGHMLLDEQYRMVQRFVFFLFFLVCCGFVLALMISL